MIDCSQTGLEVVMLLWLQKCACAQVLAREIKESGVLLVVGACALAGTGTLYVVVMDWLVPYMGW